MRKLGWIIGLLLLVAIAKAQIVERPLPNKLSQLSSVPFSNHQTQVTLSIPFWDDFSTASVVPSSALWLSGDQVRISNGTGVNAPSINVAIFDGVDATGAPYNATSLING
ncbi:MAG: hypothetical protein HWE07_02250, partial [Cytophagia bacterium]|nr:hypothetical protein [Cytophagia bacterium]